MIVSAGVSFLLSLALALGPAAPQAAPAAPPPALRSVLISLSLADVEKAAAWYGEHLGFRTTRQLALPELALRIWFLDGDGFEIEVIEFKSAIGMTAIRERFPQVDDRAKVHGFGKPGYPPTPPPGPPATR